MALTALFQIAHMLKEIAWNGTPRNKKSLSIMTQSVLTSSIDDVFNSYQELDDLQVGLDALASSFKISKKVEDKDIARYALSFIHLERKLAKDQDRLDRIASGLERVRKLIKIHPCTHEAIMANLASIYTDNISTLKFQLHISGRSVYINDASSSNVLRTLILAGVRAAVLWHQLGGRRWHLMINKDSIRQDLKQIESLLRKEEDLVT